MSMIRDLAITALAVGGATWCINAVLGAPGGVLAAIGWLLATSWTEAR